MNKNKLKHQGKHLKLNFDYVTLNGLIKMDKILGKKCCLRGKYLQLLTSSIRYNLNSRLSL